MTRKRTRTVILGVVVATMAAVITGCSSNSGSSPAAQTNSSFTAVATGPAVPSPGCTSSSTTPSTASTATPSTASTATSTATSTVEQRHNLTIDNTQRWYLLTTPVSQSGPSSSSSPLAARPLVVDLHGLEEGATVHALTTRFSTLAIKAGFVVAFPNGTGNPVSWNTNASSHPNQDLDFIAGMLTDIEQTNCIDTSRVYADGFSDGAIMTSLLACTMADRFAAFAAVSGLQLSPTCAPGRPVPILAFHGTKDPILYFNGGVGTGLLNKVIGRGGPATGDGSSTTTVTAPPAQLNGAGYPATVKAWAIKDGCNPRSTDTRISSEVIHRTYRCPSGVGVSFYIIIGGGHAWPGSAFSKELTGITGYTTFQINATDLIWAFFRQYRLG
jgi:polyhydroxybutyrate depolymerase